MGRPLKTLPPKPGKENLLIRSKAPETIADAMKDIKHGGAYEGFIGTGGNIVRKPDYIQTENLDTDQQEKRSLIRKFLVQIIEPNQLSQRSTPEMDKRSLVSKLKRGMLVDLQRMLPERLRNMTAKELKDTIDVLPNSVTDDEQAEIQEKYRDVSP